MRKAWRLRTDPQQRAIFRDESLRPACDMAVAILMDCSGSMKAHARPVSLLVDLLGRALGVGLNLGVFYRQRLAVDLGEQVDEALLMAVGDLLCRSWPASRRCATHLGYHGACHGRAAYETL